MQLFLIIVYILVLSALAIYGIHRSYLLFLFLKHRHRHAIPKAHFDKADLPLITVQLPIFNEKYVVERLLEGVAKLDYPKHLLQIQVLDDSIDETQEIAKAKTQVLAAQGFDIEYLHRKQRKGFKAGALQAALTRAKGEYLLVFDADFVPNPDLAKSLIHFFTDQKVGMVQARWGHLNRDYSILTHCQSILLDGHFVIEHTARNRSGRFFNFNGTAGIWRKHTIEDAGGWQHDTVTEDMDLSFRAQLRGWKFVYVPNTNAPAELPCEMNSFKTQQFRWAKGSVQTARKLLSEVMRAKLPWKVKLEAFFHLTNNFAYVFLILLAALQLPNMLARRTMEHPEILLLDVPLFAATCGSIAAFYLVSNRALYGETWSALKRLPMVMALGIGLAVNNARAALEGLYSPNVDFIRTPKHGITQRNTHWRTKTYRGMWPIHSLLELAFGVYFLITIILAISFQAWLSIPFLLLFATGFFYVGGLSIYQTR